MIERCEILTRRVDAQAAYQEGVSADAPERALAALCRAVRLSPDLPAYRLRFAETLALCASRPTSIRALRAEIVAPLKLVLAHGGRAAVIAEPFASVWVVRSSQLCDALTRAKDTPPSRINEALCARALHQGPAASILRALLTGVLIQNVDLLLLLEDLRENFVGAVLSGDIQLLSTPAVQFLEAIAAQVWIQDGILARAPDGHLLTRTVPASSPPEVINLLRRLLYIPGSLKGFARAEYHGDA